MSEELIQGSVEWRMARVGSLGASRLHEAIAKTKTGYGASRANLMAELICERLTGVPTEKFVTQAMQYGTEMEPEARREYEFLHGVTVRQVGLIRHPTIRHTHASPDGLVNDDGMIEIKVPQPAQQLETLLTQKIPDKYVVQMLWQMMCCDRQWTDYVSYNPSLPEHMRLFIKRLHRDDERITELETEVERFLSEIDAKLSELNRRYGQAAA